LRKSNKVLKSGGRALSRLLKVWISNDIWREFALRSFHETVRGAIIAKGATDDDREKSTHSQPHCKFGSGALHLVDCPGDVNDITSGQAIAFPYHFVHTAAFSLTIFAMSVNGSRKRKGKITERELSV
jgi:hypothetical protein